MVDKQRFGEFLRSLLGALTVAWLLVALSAPGAVFAFFLWLVAAWVFATGVAWWLVYADGWTYLAESGAFRPAVQTSTATLGFVALALALKVAATAATNRLVDPQAAGDAVWLAGSVAALVLAYAAVFLTGPADHGRSGQSL
jgi:hypothetical protein